MEMSSAYVSRTCQLGAVAKSYVEGLETGLRKLERCEVVIVASWRADLCIFSAGLSVLDMKFQEHLVPEIKDLFTAWHQNLNTFAARFSTSLEQSLSGSSGPDFVAAAQTLKKFDVLAQVAWTDIIQERFSEKCSRANQEANRLALEIEKHIPSDESFGTEEVFHALSRGLQQLHGASESLPYLEEGGLLLADGTRKQLASVYADLHDVLRRRLDQRLLTAKTALEASSYVTLGTAASHLAPMMKMKELFPDLADRYVELISLLLDHAGELSGTILRDTMVLEPQRVQDLLSLLQKLEALKTLLESDMSSWAFRTILELGDTSIGLLLEKLNSCWGPHAAISSPRLKPPRKRRRRPSAIMNLAQLDRCCNSWECVRS